LFKNLLGSGEFGKGKKQKLYISTQQNLKMSEIRAKIKGKMLRISKTNHNFRLPR